MLKLWNTVVGKLTFWKIIAGGIMAVGLYATIIRFFVGLGASSNLTDAFPWGIWIGFNIFVGIGLAAGGFTIAAAVHIFQIHRYEAIARPVILTAFLGYLSAVTALSFEVGQPWRLWHTIIMWNPHSVLFEVAWCVMLYTSVLALEFSPVVFEKLNLKVPLKLIRTVYFPLVIVGVLLSTLHQSSLGTLYVIAPDKLHPLWYTPWLPAFFFLTAIAGGLSLVIFESFLCLRAFGKSLELELLQGIGRAIVVVLGFFAVFKLQDLWIRDNLHHVFTVTPESVLFWGEMGLGVLTPMALLMSPRVRRSEKGLFLASVLTIMGVITGRMNVAVTGMAASSGVSYFPSFLEVAITLLAVTMSFVLFGLAVKFLNVFPDAHASVRDERLSAKPVFHGGVVLALWVLLCIGAVGVAYALKLNSKPTVISPAAASAVRPAFDVESLKLPPDFTFPQAKDSPGPATFRHATHLKKSNGCDSCHVKLFRLTAAGMPVEGKITDERVHQGDLCGSCHNGTTAFSTDDCDTCHK